MILRRLSSALRRQDWFIVLIELVILIIGVFLGIQAANWDEDRIAKRDYELAKQRVVAEAQANIDALETLESELTPRLAPVGEAIDILRSCEQSDESQAIVEQALIYIYGTFGITLRDSALREITESQRLLALQTENEREHYSTLRNTIEFIQNEAKLIEELPLRHPFQFNTIIDVGDLKNRDRTYRGHDWSSKARTPKLAVSFEQACQNDQLIKSLYYWERWQSEMLNISRVLTALFNEAITELNQ